MPLPPDFIFSQNNLQAYLDCPRRFELAFLEHTRWPAARAEPILEHERRLLLGTRFHQLVYQRHLGLADADLNAVINDPELALWWQNYLKFAPSDIPTQREAEVELSIPFAGYRMMARFDLLAMETGRRAVIVDWKTTFSRPSPQTLAGRIQTRLYPFVLANSSNQLGATSFDQISMLYWFPTHPQEPILFHYSREKMDQDNRFFLHLIETIAATPNGGFALTDDSRACRFCRYRSLCDRGGVAGDVSDPENLLEEDDSLFSGIDPDHIAGIAF